MEGRFKHLLTLLKIKFHMDHRWYPQKVPHGNIRPLQSSSAPEVMKIHLDPSMPTFDPEDLIGRILLLPPEENGERHSAKVTRKVMEIIEMATE